MEPKTKQSLLVTVVGVTLFVALLRLSDVLAFAAKLIDLVLPILAGGILALFINVPMTGLEKRLNRLFGKAKKQPSAKAIHLLSFFITLLGVVLVLVLALTLLIPELVQSFHSLYVQIEANIPRWTAYLNAQDADMGWLMNWLEGINWEQLLHKVTASIDTVLVNAVGAVSATVNIAITASFALIISVYMSLSTESLGHQARTLVCAYLKPAHAAGVLHHLPQGCFPVGQGHRVHPQPKDAALVYLPAFQAFFRQIHCQNSSLCLLFLPSYTRWTGKASPGLF